MLYPSEIDVHCDNKNMSKFQVHPFYGFGNIAIFLEKIENFPQFETYTKIHFVKNWIE